MEMTTSRVAPVHNVGLADRTLRFLIGVVLLGYGVLGIALGGSSWDTAIAILLSIYPLMTSIVGWDPNYHVLRMRTCSIEHGRNQCGTLPYEVDAALGHNPAPPAGHEYDHSLAGASHRH